MPMSYSKGGFGQKEDGNEEDFKNWVFGEYEFYRNDPDKYEVPYHGLFDAESKVEKLIKKIQLGVLQSQRAGGSLKLRS